MRRWSTVLCATGVALASPAVQAQGHEVLPWGLNRPVPVLQATDLTGKTWRLTDLRGRAVLVNFWASWCEPCRAEMPALQALAQSYGPEKLVVLAVNFKESAPVVQRYVQRVDLQLPVLLDTQGQMARHWGATVFPTTVLIGADGRVRALVRGEFDWSGSSVAALLAPLLVPESMQR